MISLLLNLTALIFLINAANAEVYDGNSMPSVDSTLTAIQQADSMGADTSELAKRLNAAIDLLEQAKTSNFDSCSSSSDCTNSANELLSSTFDDANTLKDNAQLASNMNMVTSVAYAFIVAFIISLVGIYCYGRWKSLQLKRFLDMEIREEQ